MQRVYICDAPLMCILVLDKYFEIGTWHLFIKDDYSSAISKLKKCMDILL